MTMPHERTRAILAVRDFLQRISSPYSGGIKGVKREIREEARHLLRHYPLNVDLFIAARTNPELFAPPEMSTFNPAENNDTSK